MPGMRWARRANFSLIFPWFPPFSVHFVPALRTCCCLKTDIATLRYTTPYIICLGRSSQQALWLWTNKKRTIFCSLAVVVCCVIRAYGSWAERGCDI